MAADAEAAGWDGVFLWDHVVLMPDLRLDVHDPWVLLGAMAQATGRAARHPRHPAGPAPPLDGGPPPITLDHLSGGRATLGPG